MGKITGTKDVAILVTVTVSRTINLGNYESVRIEASAKIGRNEDGDTSEELRERAIEECTSMLDDA